MPLNGSTTASSELIKRFEEYLEEWKRLDSIEIHSIWKFLFPIGFILEMRILNKKSKLTANYSNYIDSIQDASRISSTK